MKTFKKRVTNLIAKNTRLWRRNPAGLPPVAEVSLRLFDRLKAANPTLNLSFTGEVRSNVLKVTAQVGGIEHKLPLNVRNDSRQWFHREPLCFLEKELQKNLESQVARKMAIQREFEAWKAQVSATPARVYVQKVTHWGSGRRTYVKMHHPLFRVRVPMSGLPEDPEIFVWGLATESPARAEARSWLHTEAHGAYKIVAESVGLPAQPDMRLAHDSWFGSYPADGEECKLAESEWVEMTLSL